MPAYRVIIIDPDQMWRKDAVRYLAEAGLESADYPDLLSAMKALHKTNGRPALVFVDQHLAQEEIGLFRILSDRTVNPHLYTIVLFPETLSVSEMTRFFHKGAYDNVDKPYGRISTIKIVQDFIHEIENLIQTQPQEHTKVLITFEPELVI